MFIFFFQAEDGIRDYKVTGVQTCALPICQFLLPGMVDLHVHAPQWPQSGKALDVPLETWLQEYTFPLEARYGDAGFATSVYDSVVRTLLANGTTTAMYFGKIGRAHV